MNLCIDLCSGLCGLSSAFKANEWEVITVDIEPKFEPTICKDIRQVTRQDIRAVAKQPLASYEVIVVVASPPCERWSIANQKWPTKGIRQALEIVAAVLELIAELKPDYWLLENPRGRLRWILGKPPHTINLSDYGYPSKKPTDLWGNIPLPMIQVIRSFPRIYSEKRQRQETWIQHQGRDPAKRAEMPLGLSQAILQSVTREAV